MYSILTINIHPFLSHNHQMFCFVRISLSPLSSPLSQWRQALPKFIKSVSWTGGKESKTEVQEALDLLEQWQPLNAAEALELLSADFTEEKTHPAIRKYAVSRLQRVDSEVRMCVHMHSMPPSPLLSVLLYVHDDTEATQWNS